MILRFVNGTDIGASQRREIFEEFRINHNPVHVPQQVIIRPYEPQDRPTICRLCCDTGFLGKPVDKIFQDRELFADLFTKAYLDHEPGWAMVAEVDRRVVGYLLGSVCKQFELVLLRSGFFTTAKMVFRLLTGQYSDHPRSKRFVRWLLSSGFREQPQHPREAAHLHLDIDRNYRGRGIGRHLWDVYDRRLQAAGVKRCYGSFFSHQRRRPEQVYARYGFEVFDRRRTTLFEPEVSEPIEVVCVTKDI